METTVNYLDGVKFQVEARGHRIICDQPVGNGGADAGMTPPEFMLASLGTCAGFYAAQYLRARSLPLAGLKVHVSAEKATQPARLGSFHVRVEAPGVEDERHHEGLMRAIKACLIHNTLHHPPTVEIELETGCALPISSSH